MFGNKRTVPLRPACGKMCLLATESFVSVQLISGNSVHILCKFPLCRDLLLLF